MSHLERTIELKQILNILLIPTVIIDIIYSYTRLPHKLLLNINVPSEHTYYTIDDNVFECTYDYKTKKNTYKSILTPSICYSKKYDGHNSLSFKYKLKDHGCSRSMYGVYYGFRFCRLYMNNPHVNIKSLLPNEFKNMNIHHFAIYINELYISVQDSEAGTRWNLNAQMNIFQINLQTRSCIFITTIPYGRLFVSKSYIYTHNYSRILNIYNKINKEMANMKLDLDIIVHINDNYVYNVHNHMLQTRLLKYPNEIIDEIDAILMDFQSSHFYVMQRTSSDKTNLSVYNINAE